MKMKQTLVLFALFFAKIAASQNVGIGTATPEFKLDVYNVLGPEIFTGNTLARFRGLGRNFTRILISHSSYSSAAEAEFGADDFGAFAGSASNQEFRIRTGGSDRIAVGQTVTRIWGSVGIDVPNPGGNKLSVGGGATLDYSGQSIGDLTKGLRFGGDFSNEGIASNRSVLGNNSLGLDFFTNGIPRISITNNGKVGIGTTNPGTALTVNGGIAAESQTVTISGLTATVNPGNRSYIRINNSSNFTTVVTIGDGLSDGQLLIVLAQSSGGGVVHFIDAAANNIQLNSNYLMGADDTLTLIWDATLGKWIEIHRSVN